MLEIGNLFKSISKEIINKNDINDFVKQIEERLNNMENEIKTYTIDRFEGNIAVCEDRETKEIINIDKSKLPINAKEGNIVCFKNNKYELETKKEEEISNRIQEKMNKLWNN